MPKIPTQWIPATSGTVTTENSGVIRKTQAGIIRKTQAGIIRILQPNATSGPIPTIWTVND